MFLLPFKLFYKKKYIIYDRCIFYRILHNEKIFSKN